MITGNVNSAISVKPQFVKIDDNNFINANRISEIYVNGKNCNTITYTKSNGENEVAYVADDDIEEIIKPAESNFQVFG